MDDGCSMREVGRAGVSLRKIAMDRAARKDSWTSQPFADTFTLVSRRLQTPLD